MSYISNMNSSKSQIIYQIGAWSFAPVQSNLEMEIRRGEPQGFQFSSCSTMDFVSFSTFNPCTHARLSRSPCPTSGIKPRFNPNSNLGQSMVGFSSRRFLWFQVVVKLWCFCHLGLRNSCWADAYNGILRAPFLQMKSKGDENVDSEVFLGKLSNRRKKNQPRQSQRPKSTTFAAKHVWIKCTPLMEQASPHFLRKVQVFEGRVSQ